MRRQLSRIMIHVSVLTLAIKLSSYPNDTKAHYFALFLGTKERTVYFTKVNNLSNLQPRTSS